MPTYYAELTGGTIKARETFSGGTIYSTGGATVIQNIKSAAATPSSTSQHISITPDVGYDAMGEVQLTVDAIPPEYIIPTGTKTITTNGTHDVKAYQNAYVNVQGGGGATLETKSVSYTPSESAISDTLLPDVGYDGFSEVDVSVGAIPSNYVGSSVPRKSSSDLTASGATVTAPAGYYSENATKTIPNAPSPRLTDVDIESNGTATATVEVDDDGYIQGQTFALSLANAVTVQAAQTITPGITNQTIPAYRWTTGAQTILGDADLVASNIKKDVTIFGVTGTYEGGGGGGYTNNDFADLSKPIGEVATTLASLPPYFFYNRTGITKFTGNNVTTLESPSYAYCHTFYGCTALQEVVLPNVTQLTDKNSVFRNCTSLRKVDLSSVKTLNSASCFQSDSQLEGIVFPSALSADGNAGTTLGNNMFNGCTSLAYFDSAMVYNIQAATFTNCASLSVVVIRYSPNTNAGNICALANVSAFNGTPFASGGSGGTLYVPSDKISAYQAATNWSTILGYANNQIKAIEGSYYETHWADGTVIS